MGTETLNKNLCVTFPDEFRVMTEEEMIGVFGDKNRNRWVIRDDDRHITVSFFWFKPYKIVSSLWDAKATAEKTEAKMKKAAKGCDYKCKEFFTRQICGQEAHGFSYEYTLRGEKQVGEAVALKVDPVCYTIYYYAGNAEDPDEKSIFDEILNSLTIQEKSLFSVLNSGKRH